MYFDDIQIKTWFRRCLNYVRDTSSRYRNVLSRFFLLSLPYSQKYHWPLVIHPGIVSKFSYDSNEKTFRPTGFFHWPMFVNMHAVTSRKKIMIFESTRMCVKRCCSSTPPIETLQSLKLIGRMIWKEKTELIKIPLFT